MNSLMSKKKNDASHCGSAIPSPGFSEHKAASKREKTGVKKDLEAPCGSKIKHALHAQPFLCFNERVDSLKKTP